MHHSNLLSNHLFYSGPLVPIIIKYTLHIVLCIYLYEFSVDKQPEGMQGELRLLLHHSFTLFIQ